MAIQQAKAVILLVDDEPVVRDFVQRALEFYGYAVLSASNPQDALELSRRFTGTIDLLLTGLKMPGMLGPELAAILQLERPQIRILLMTGRSSGLIPHHLKPATLHKPFATMALIARVREALDPDR